MTAPPHRRRRHPLRAAARARTPSSGRRRPRSGARRRRRRPRGGRRAAQRATRPSTSHLMPANLFAERFGIRPPVAFGMNVGGATGLAMLAQAVAAGGVRCRPARAGGRGREPRQRADPGDLHQGAGPGRARPLRGAARRHGAGVLRAAGLPLPVDLRAGGRRAGVAAGADARPRRAQARRPVPEADHRRRRARVRGRWPSRCGCSTAARSPTAVRRSSSPRRRPPSARWSSPAPVRPTATSTCRPSRPGRREPRWPPSARCPRRGCPGWTSTSSASTTASPSPSPSCSRSWASPRRAGPAPTRGPAPSRWTAATR